MATGKQMQQVNGSHRKKFSPRWRWAAAICLILALLGIMFVILWILTQLGVIAKPWSTIIASTLGTIGAVIGAIFSAVVAIIVAIEASNKDSLLRGFFSRDSSPSRSSPTEQTLPGIMPPVTHQEKIPLQSVDNPSDRSPENGSPVTERAASRMEGSSWIPFQWEICEPTQLPITQGDPNDIFPFLAPSPTASQEVYGWKSDRDALLHCVRRGAGASIVGPRRIGKSWLLHYVRLEISIEHRLGANYRVCYLDANRCATVDGFTVLVLEQLGVRVSPDNVPLNLGVLDRAISKLISHNILPVLCLDEFESLSGSPSRRQEFDIQFYRGLRAMGQVGLRLVVASKHDLIKLMPYDPESSPFFNTFEKFQLRPFNRIEAETFAEKKGELAGFTDRERRLLLKYGTKDGHQWMPVRLQLVGKEMFTAKSLAVSEDSSYRPDDLDYWRRFEKEVDKKYDAVVVE